MADNPKILIEAERLFRPIPSNALTQDPEPRVINQDQDNDHPKFRITSAAELVKSPKLTDWAIKGFFERGSLIMLFGPPASCKSSIALEWGFCMAAGLEWCGRKVKSGPVVIVCGEGFSGLTRRLKALEIKCGIDTPAQLYITHAAGNFLDPQNTAWVADAIKAICPRPAMVIIDTLHRNMGGDENSAKDIARLLSNIDNHIRPLGCAVLLVHHSGHGATDRARGSSSIKGSLDAEYSVSKTENIVVLKNEKAKDFEPPVPLSFNLVIAELDWLDEDGEPETSIYLNYDGEASAAPKKRKLSARDDAVLTSLTDAINKNGVEPTREIKEKFAGPGVSGWCSQRVVSIEHWRPLAYRSIVIDEGNAKAKRLAFWRVRTKLLNQGLIVEYDGFAWRIF